MVDELRELIYIDEQSLNSNLSSMGEGVLQEIEELSGQELTQSGNAEQRVPEQSISEGGEKSLMDAESVRSTMEVLAPYRFRRLEDLVEQNDISVFTGNEGNTPSRTQAIKINGKMSAMSIFRIELVMNALGGVFSPNMISSMEQIEAHLPELGQQEDLSEISVIDHVSSVFSSMTGDKLPLRLDLAGYPFAVPLKREYLIPDPEDAFLEEREYTVFGRVKRVLDNEKWDPAIATRILNQYVHDPQLDNDSESEVREMAADLGITVDDDHLSIGPTGCVIHPIAVYW